MGGLIEAYLSPFEQLLNFDLPSVTVKGIYIFSVRIFSRHSLNKLSSVAIGQIYLPLSFLPPLDKLDLVEWNRWVGVQTMAQIVKSYTKI